MKLLRKETIKITDLTTGYHSRHGVREVTKDINASLYSGELTCLLGPNGAGKSTLLKTLIAFIPPISGEIVIKGKTLDEYSDSELAETIGVVLTDKVNLENMTAEQLVALGRSPYTGFWGRLGQDDRQIVEEAIKLVGIEELRSRTVRTLSDGERQKVMIAKVLAQETPVIFLDEPAAFLDYPSKVEIMQLLQRLAREKGKTVFLSTHDLELALQIADKVWLLDKVNGVSTGTPEDLALDGTIGRYFNREGLIFDGSAGLFRINYPIKKSYRLIGEKSRFNMVRKAFLRNGIGVSEDKACETVEIFPNGVYDVKGEKANSIEELLLLVNS